MRVLLTQLHREKYSSHDSTGLFSPFPPMTLCCGCVSVLCHSETVIKRWTLSANESHSKFVCQHGNFSKIFLSPTEIFPKTFCFSGSHLPPLLCGNGTFFSCFANRNLVFQKLTLIFFFCSCFCRNREAFQLWWWCSVRSLTGRVSYFFTEKFQFQHKLCFKHLQNNDHRKWPAMNNKIHYTKL